MTPQRKTKFTKIEQLVLDGYEKGVCTPVLAGMLGQNRKYVQDWCGHHGRHRPDWHIKVVRSQGALARRLDISAGQNKKPRPAFFGGGKPLDPLQKMAIEGYSQGVCMPVLTAILEKPEKAVAYFCTSLGAARPYWYKSNKAQIAVLRRRLIEADRKAGKPK